MAIKYVHARNAPVPDPWEREGLAQRSLGVSFAADDFPRSPEQVSSW